MKEFFISKFLFLQAAKTPIEVKIAVETALFMNCRLEKIIAASYNELNFNLQGLKLDLVINKRF